MRNSVNVGEMDKWLVAQARTESKDSKGQLIRSWTDSFNFFAAEEDVRTDENFSGLATVAPVRTAYVTHSRPDLYRSLRIRDIDSNYWEIIAVIRLVGGMYMRIECQRMDE